MSGESRQGALAPSNRKEGTVGNKDSPSRFSVAARALWPRKTAAELAFRAKVTERAAKFWLSGHRDPSLDAIMVIVNEIRGRRRV
jgi:hypothetical protein